MASSYSTDLKLELMVTGEKAGQWGDITNSNLVVLQQAIAGYEAISLNATTGATLTFSNGALSDGKNQVLKLTGTITTNVNVTIPDSVEKTYVIENGTTGAFTVTVKTSSGSGVTWGTTDKGTKMVYSDGTNVVDTAFTDLSSDTTPQLSANLDTNGNNILVDDTKGILDDSSNEQLIFSKTASAVNNIQIKNAATSSAPEISAIGDDSNIDLTITPKGDGNVVLDGLKYPNADGSTDQFLKTDGSGNLTFADAGGGTSWQSAIKTTTFTAVAGEGYWVNTTGGTFTATLPGSASVGDTIEFIDYNRTFGTNALSIDPNGLNYQGFTTNAVYTTDGQGIRIVYSGATKGWTPTSDDDVALASTYQASYLVIAGGGGGGFDQGAGGGAGGYRTSFGTDTSGGNSSTETPLVFTKDTVYTVTVGSGGAGSGDGSNLRGSNGTDSSISGTGITTVTSAGGGGGGGGAGQQDGADGGSGGGANSGAAGSGTVGQGFDGANAKGGGGGAGQAGQAAPSYDGGDGLFGSITASSVARAGGGGGNQDNFQPVGGTGGGGDGSQNSPRTPPTNGSANTGGGGGAGVGTAPARDGANGGSGVVIIRIPTAQYSGTTTGSPTVTTDGGDTILTFTASGSLTG